MKTAAQVTQKLAASGAENVRQIYLRQGAEHAYGVQLAAVRAIAKELGTNHALGLELWKTGAHEARIIACTILDPRALTEKEARALVGSVTYGLLADELVSRVVAEAPFADTLGASFRDANEDFARRAGWKILAERVAAGREREPAAVLDRLEREMPGAPFRAKEGMNYCLVQIGIRVPALTERAVAIGERIGVWDLRPIPKGCTSAYAPEWIGVLLARKSPEWKSRWAKAVAVRDEALRAAREKEKAAGKSARPAKEPSRAATPKKATPKKAAPKKAAPKKATPKKAAPKKAAPKKAAPKKAAPKKRADSVAQKAVTKRASKAIGKKAPAPSASKKASRR